MGARRLYLLKKYAPRHRPSVSLLNEVTRLYITHSDVCGRSQLLEPSERRTEGREDRRRFIFFPTTKFKQYLNVCFFHESSRAEKRPETTT